MLRPTEALERLIEGNQRFQDGKTIRKSPDSDLLAELSHRQSPFAVVLGCADSRVPVGTVFDQGLGDLFVVRVAGNIATTPEIGSIEFAVSSFDTRLIIVLGHSNCGAIETTLRQIENPGPLTEGIASIVETIRPAVETALKKHPNCSDSEKMEIAVRANVQATTARLKKNSPMLSQMLTNGDIVIKGAEYCLKTGQVQFLEDEK